MNHFKRCEGKDSNETPTFNATVTPITRKVMNRLKEIEPHELVNIEEYKHEPRSSASEQTISQDKRVTVTMKAISVHGD